MKNTLALFFFVLICFGFSNSVWAQRGGYPGLGPWEDYNSYGQSYAFFINKDNRPDKQGFSVKEYTSSAPFFQVNTDGQMTFGSQNSHKAASLAFFQGVTGYGEINTSAQNFNFLADRQINFFPQGGSVTLVLGSEEALFSTNLHVDKNDIRVRVGTTNNNGHGWLGTTSNKGCYVGANDCGNLYLDTNYGVYVGLAAIEVEGIRAELKNKYKLFVKKGVLAEDYAIAPKTSWSDFVFHKDYNLRPLAEVERFIEKNKHLPDVPSAEEVAKKGYSQHDVNKALLQKVEELGSLFILGDLTFD